MALSSVDGQLEGRDHTWTKQKCGMENNKLYYPTSNLITCNDYCKSISWGYGNCEINAGYGECLCGYIHL